MNVRLRKNEGQGRVRDWQAKAGKRVLVAGGAGFLGSHLCESLLAAGNAVTCLDDLSTGSAGNVEHLRRSGRFTLIAHDVASFDGAGRLDIGTLEADEVYNLACPASPTDYQRNPVKTLKTSVWGALNLLEFARQRRIPVFQASTSEIYGDPHCHPQREDYWGNVNPIGPRSCYDEGKRCAETLFFDFRRQYGLNTKVARIFNTYGPRMRPDDGRVVSNFIVQCLRGQAITIYGDGSQTRSFCYVDDLIEGFIRLMESPAEVSGPINLGNPGEFTIRELAELVIAITGTRSRIIHRPLPTDDPRQRRPDISHAGAVLGWKPSVSLVEGLTRTTAYFDAILSGRTYAQPKRELVA